MARPPQELPDNQITPVAKPVDAFISPKQYQVAKPAAPDFLPQVKGITQVGTNSVGSYQGYNQAEQLASSLSKFNPALTNALQTGGVMLAGKIMDDNHKAAVAAARTHQRVKARRLSPCHLDRTSSRTWFTARVLRFHKPSAFRKSASFLWGSAIPRVTASQSGVIACFGDGGTGTASDQALPGTGVDCTE